MFMKLYLNLLNVIDEIRVSITPFFAISESEISAMLFQNRVLIIVSIASLGIAALFYAYYTQTLKNEQKLSAYIGESEQRMSALLSNLPGMAYRCRNDRNWTMQYVSEGCYRLTGYTKEELLHNNMVSYNDIILQSYRENIWTTWQDKLQNRETVEMEYEIQTKDGMTKWVWEQGRGVFDDQERVIALEGLIIDISERIENTRIRKLSEEKLTTVLKSIGDGVITVDKKGRIDFINPMASELLEISQNLNGEDFDELFSFQSTMTKQPVESPIYQCLNNKKTSSAEQLLIMNTHQGKSLEVESNASPLINLNTIEGVVLVFRDVSSRLAKEREIEYLSYHDELTGLYNRRFFEEEIKRLDMPRNLPITLIMSDVNGLKIINDGFGHPVGDQLLQSAAMAIKNSCRNDEIIARMGGDEFAILLPGVNEEEAMKVISRMNKNAAASIIMGLPVSIAFGFATKNEPHESILKILQAAEDRMYQNKITEGSTSRNQTIKVMLQSLFSRSPREEAHILHVSHICELFATVLGFDRDQTIELKLAAQLHDIGKIAIEQRILEKPELLSDHERVQMERHTETGFRILSTTAEYLNVAQIVYDHHEKVDGSGYPRGLKGDQIPIGARMLSIAEAVDAMSNDQPHRKAMNKEQIKAELIRCSNTQFDGRLVDIFIQFVLDQLFESK
jgi:diguanylate cyclase (GGDEF)-like protein/PAS domain S-box-containing protein/putative nucleotidyltransferase with HDIG domain